MRHMMASPYDTDLIVSSQRFLKVFSHRSYADPDDS